ncbi:MAG: TRAP transporter small permease subunit [Gammaproteobacteria bacterium]|nr:TRAP transporter small permease subunit [Gammaproteobacteria bacterium]
MRIADVLEALIEHIGRWASWATLILVLLVAINVILRYAFRIGPVALQELEWHLLSPITLIGMSYTMRHGEHVRVDIFYRKFPQVVRHRIDFLAAMVTVIISIVIIKLSLDYVWQAWSIGEHSPDPGGLPFRFLLKSFIPLGFFLLFLQAAAQSLRIGVLLLMTGRGHG